MRRDALFFLPKVTSQTQHWIRHTGGCIIFRCVVYGWGYWLLMFCPIWPRNKLCSRQHHVFIYFYVTQVSFNVLSYQRTLSEYFQQNNNNWITIAIKIFQVSTNKNRWLCVLNTKIKNYQIDRQKLSGQLPPSSLRPFCHQHTTVNHSGVTYYYTPLQNLESPDSMCWWSSTYRSSSK